MFAKFCGHTSNGDLKRRHSWNSELDHRPAETESETLSEEDPSPVLLLADDEDGTSCKENGRTMQTVDLVADCPLATLTASSVSSAWTRTPSPSSLTPLRSSMPFASTRSMGQRPSTLLRPKISLTWVLRGQQQQQQQQQQRPDLANGNHSSQSLVNGSIGDASENQDALSRENKERSSCRSLRSIKSVRSVKGKDTEKENIDFGKKREKKIERIEGTEKLVDKESLISERPLDSPLGKHSEKEFSSARDARDGRGAKEREREKVKRAVSEPSLVSRDSGCAYVYTTPNTREKHRHRRPKRPHKPRQPSASRFGYEIADLDAFLTKASIERPANIPVVLSFPSVLYQTQGGTQDEMALPLGTVVNAVFKNQTWLYVQTPHGQEGYVGYAACLPLGILPQPTRGPCWEDSTDVFPRPLGNMTDTEKLRDTRSECGARGRASTSRIRTSDPRKNGTRDAVSACGERSVDRLYLRAAANARSKGSRHTLLVIHDDYEARGANSLTVSKGDVVALLGNYVDGWFWVRSQDGREGFIPAVIAGHGFF